MSSVGELFDIISEVEFSNITYQEKDIEINIKGKVPDELEDILKLKPEVHFIQTVIDNINMAQIKYTKTINNITGDYFIVIRLKSPGNQEFEEFTYIKKSQDKLYINVKNVNRILTIYNPAWKNLIPEEVDCIVHPVKHDIELERQRRIIMKALKGFSTELVKNEGNKYSMKLTPKNIVKTILELQNYINDNKDLISKNIYKILDDLAKNELIDLLGVGDATYEELIDFGMEVLESQLTDITNLTVKEPNELKDSIIDIEYNTKDEIRSKTDYNIIYGDSLLDIQIKSQGILQKTDNYNVKEINYTNAITSKELMDSISKLFVRE